ncbi:hypothetical protein BDV36DRAFT_242311 [Aspergillus pseudocaelatus]|uniref:Uncharacterized protein n=1 Tax=Aspergillus pseudocaelatus TaxID=1825620 RepID=A0ABQ6X3H4_9EURO|nr:hypothetical protein BDV36DRAFT_242311 [Aspergillus pseudocaelatus]
MRSLRLVCFHSDRIFVFCDRGTLRDPAFGRVFFFCQRLCLYRILLPGRRCGFLGSV